jgi:hypothetical protein
VTPLTVTYIVRVDFSISTRMAACDGAPANTVNATAAMAATLERTLSMKPDITLPRFQLPFRSEAWRPAARLVKWEPLDAKSPDRSGLNRGL